MSKVNELRDRDDKQIGTTETDEKNGTALLTCRSSATLYADRNFIPIGSSLESRNRNTWLVPAGPISAVGSRINRKCRMLNILVDGVLSENRTSSIEQQLASNKPLVSVATCDQQTIERQGLTERFQSRLPSHTYMTEAMVSYNRKLIGRRKSCIGDFIVLYLGTSIISSRFISKTSSFVSRSF